MVPMFNYSDIVILMGTFAFLFSYALAIFVQIFISKRKLQRFSLGNVFVALLIGFAGSIATFFLLYCMFGRA
jgi:hypothetical protein